MDPHIQISAFPDHASFIKQDKASIEPFLIRNTIIKKEIPDLQGRGITGVIKLINS